MPTKKDPPVQSWFDIETTGVTRPVMGEHFLQSSVLEIGFTDPTQGGEPISLVAKPASKKMSTWSYNTVWEPLQRTRPIKNQAMATEQAILRKFLTHLQNLPDGSELLGWNIGYSPRVVGAREAIGGGYDVPGITTRAATYGMEKQFQEQFGRLKLRDVGAEFAVKLTNQIYGKEGTRQLNELIRVGLLDPAAVAGKRLNLIDELLEYTMSQGISPLFLYKRLEGYQQQGITPSSSIEEMLRKIGKHTAIDQWGGKKMSSELRRQVFGMQKLMLAETVNPTLSRAISHGHLDPQGVGRLAQRTSIGGGKLAGWAQETAQFTFMELWGSNVNNRLVREYARIHGVTPEEALKVLSSSQMHLGKEDVMIAQALTSIVDDFDNILGDPQRRSKFFSIWGKVADKRRMLSSVKAHGFSGDAIQRLTKPTDGNLGISPFFTEQEFFDELNKEAVTRYGDNAGKGWEAELRGLQETETLEHKFRLSPDKELKHFGLAEIQMPEIEQRAGLFKASYNRIGGKGIAAAAVATAVITQPLSLFGPEEDFRELEPYWQHTLLGIPKISGSDDKYNTIQGLGHGSAAQGQRSVLTDFGSGWIPGRGRAEDHSNPEFALDPSMEARRRVANLKKSGRVTESELSSFRRAQQYSEDATLGNYLMQIAENTPGGERFASGYLLTSVGDYLSPGPFNPETMYGVSMDPAVLEFRKNTLQDPDAYAEHQQEYKAAQREGREQLGSILREEMFEEDLSRFRGISLHASNLRAVALKNFTMDVEDADTLVLKRKGLLNIFDDPIQIRLSGIDAPEVGGHGHDPMAKWRVNQNQPYGKQAAAKLRHLVEQQDNLSLLIDPTQTTYGRHVGALFGDEGVSLNLELIRQGAASALPWGTTTGDIVDRTVAEQYETEAATEERGMWRHARYKAIREMGKAIGADITHNTLTDITKLAKNPDLAGWANYLEAMGPMQYRDLAPSERSSIRAVGANLQRTGIGSRRRPAWQTGYNKSGRTFGLGPIQSPTQSFKYKLYQPQIPLTSDDEAYVQVEGLRHGGSAAAGRQLTDFGSGWKWLKNAVKRYHFPETGETFTRYAKSNTPVSKTPTSSIAKKKLMEDSSMHTAVATRGIRQSSIPQETIGQVNNFPSNERFPRLSLATKDFTSYTPHNRITGKMDIPDISSKNIGSNQKHLQDEMRVLRRKSSLDAVRRRHRFVAGGKMAPVLRSRHGHNAGKRSRMNSGVTNFVAGL